MRSRLICWPRSSGMVTLFQPSRNFRAPDTAPANAKVRQVDGTTIAIAPRMRPNFNTLRSPTPRTRNLLATGCRWYQKVRNRTIQCLSDFRQHAGRLPHSVEDHEPLSSQPGGVDRPPVVPVDAPEAVQLFEELGPRP